MSNQSPCHVGNSKGGGHSTWSQRRQRPAQRILVAPWMLVNAEAHGLLVALAADNDHVARLGQPDGVQDGTLAVGDAEEVDAFRPAGRQPTRSGLRHDGRGPPYAGSSVVTTVTSASRAATSPIRRRFWSRSPAEPKTTMTRPPGPPAGGRLPRRAPGHWAVSRNRRSP